jgi:hypothetical protein
LSVEQNKHELTADVVAERLIEAFAINRRLPRIERPRAPGSHMRVVHSRADVKDWEVEELDPTRLPPTPPEIVAMERAFSWLLPVAEASLENYQALKAWCSVKLTGKPSLRSIARSWGIPPMKFLRRKDRALAMIVQNLKAAGATA